LEKEREYRQKSAGEVKSQVETITSSPPDARPTVVLPSSRSKPDRFWRWFAVVVLGLIVVPVGLILMGISYSRLRFVREQENRVWKERLRVAAAATSEAQGKFVIGPTQVDFKPLGSEMHWGFDLFVPANNLASILFVRWDNAVPTILPGFSAYFKVGPAGGVDIRYCVISCEPIPHSQVLAMTNAQGRQDLARWGISSSESTNVVQWNVCLGLGFTSSQWLATPASHRLEVALPQTVRTGYQRSMRLVDFLAPEQDKGGHVRCGIELRILVEPLRSTPIKTVPYEIVQTNYIAGTGLAGTMEQTLQSMKTLPVEP
jgi:hypothetical protein